MKFKAFISFIVTSAIVICASHGSGTLLEGFKSPPEESRARAYWWWLNGNVTKDAITRDLEGMKNKGFGGAIVCDAGGADQRGHKQVPQGPVYGSAEWRELFKHAVNEASRLGITLSLNIQSGWNLGGPLVKPQDAAKKLTWSTTRLKGPTHFNDILPQPNSNNDFYRDVAVIAYPETKPEKTGFVDEISASSSQNEFPPNLAFDGDPGTYWVSGGKVPGEGPNQSSPEWLQINLKEPREVRRILLTGRSDYGPAEFAISVPGSSDNFNIIEKSSVSPGKTSELELNNVTSSRFRIVFLKAFDPRHPDAPRNVQVAELQLIDVNGDVIGKSIKPRPIELLDYKTASKEYGWSCPDTSPLVSGITPVSSKAELHSEDMINLTEYTDTEGRLKWDVPEGGWTVFRFGYTITGAEVSTSSETWNGLAIDYLDDRALRKYWDQVVEPILQSVSPSLTGSTLKYAYTDSWELGGINWSKEFTEEFKRRRGYEILPYLPVITGKIVDDRRISNRFLNDFRRTIGDLIVDNHYRVMLELAGNHDMGIHPESGGPHGAPIDALQCLGVSDFPMMEFWARAKTHRVRDEDRFFTKQAASAAHIYNRRFVAAEGFTSIGPQWEEVPWKHLKPAFDRAACEGLNRLVWHTFTCSPKEMGLPGQEYFAGTHFNPNITWWELSDAFIAYINRCQYMLQQGHFIADACYFYGSQVPNFVQLKTDDPANILPGFGYDVINEEALLTRLDVENGRLTLPGGIQYRALVLPNSRYAISHSAFKKIAALVKNGATVVGSKPALPLGLGPNPADDSKFKQLADALFGPHTTQAQKAHAFGKGRVVNTRSTREFLLSDGVLPDFEYKAYDNKAELDYIHRRAGDADIYFISNRRDTGVFAQCTFRVADKTPALWFPDTGETRRLPVFKSTAAGQTTIPLQLDPFGSVFVVFEEPAAKHIVQVEQNGKPLFPITKGSSATPNADFFYTQKNTIALRAAASGDYSIKLSTGESKSIHVPAAPSEVEVTGNWTLDFPENRGAPDSVVLGKLKSWTEFKDPGIKFFSGIAVYTKTIELPRELVSRDNQLLLNLGAVHEFAEVSLNGNKIGTLWKPPFLIDVSNAAKPGKNRLKIRVANLWPNRIIGDSLLPKTERFTKTNIRKFTGESEPLISGLLGPVRLITRINRTISWP
ncbi:MAG: discoidin domain-containing protein [Verrucomicrobia bacterium]|nr:discoidin domain-containing protein [Verrucomicrobiota bacterium]MCF7709295.1 discoidin domain-containing protein [Verrucomicrobiota bacterium]